ncbi:KH domain-containing protein [Candidatus Gottesmanbacteria bacterium]|nr:KH domain-containing protein [Candidatus Gottesmanbacteria bacterium]
MKNLLEFIAKNILTNPDDVKIEEVDQNNTVLLKMNVSKEDMGKVIGKEGKIIKAIRALLKIRGLMEGKKVELQLIEPV